MNKSNENRKGEGYHPKEPSKSKKRGVMCDMCGAQLSDKRTLRRHRQALHERVRSRCDWCRNWLESRPSLVKHLRVCRNRPVEDGAVDFMNRPRSAAATKKTNPQTDEETSEDSAEEENLRAGPPGGKVREAHEISGKRSRSKGVYNISGEEQPLRSRHRDTQKESDGPWTEEQLKEAIEWGGRMLLSNPTPEAEKRVIRRVMGKYPTLGRSAEVLIKAVSWTRQEMSKTWVEKEDSVTEVEDESGNESGSHFMRWRVEGGRLEKNAEGSVTRVDTKGSERDSMGNQKENREDDIQITLIRTPHTDDEAKKRGLLMERIVIRIDREDEEPMAEKERESQGESETGSKGLLESKLTLPHPDWELPGPFLTEDEF